MDKLKILVLEGEDKFRNKLDNFLREKGYFVYSTVSTFEAVQILDDKQIDIAFVDQVLSETNAVNLIKKVRYINPNTATVVISTNTDPANISSVFASGARDILLKPFGSHQLKEIIARFKPHVRHLNGHEKDDLNNRFVGSGLTLSTG
jgi:DNA-binding response OmpR family regulator